ncbi:unnamed protein product [Microthlaspi erraticum]|uniref:Pentacotripeptide-repeat region of PRORP domain-containing protein n=1 Tax=Microthlaspi erraticum TaxID=1685480 RepID=A0A6D2ICS6_9BRAS|nr:unnamed protein product [Microthlaspi erraticum]
MVSSSVPPLAFSQITRRLGSYSLAVSFFEYVDEKSQSLKRREEYLSLVLQSLIEFAGSQPDSKDKLVNLYEIAKEKNIPLTLVAAKLLIRWFGRMGMVDQSVLVYESLDSNSKNTQVRNVVIDVLLRNRLVDYAFKVLDEMLQKDSVFPPNRITADIVFHEVWSGRRRHSEDEIASLVLRFSSHGVFANCLVDSLSRLRNRLVDYAFKVWSGRRRHSEDEIASLVLRFSSHGVSPNSVWLTRFITSLCRNSRTNVAWEILSDLMKNKAPLEAPPFNSLLTCLVRKMDTRGMDDIVEKMDEMGIKPDVVTLGIRIKSLCKSRRVDEAMEVFGQLCGKKTDGGNVIKADLILYNTLIDGLCKVGRMKEAEDLLAKMRKEETFAPNSITYNCLIDGYCREDYSADHIEFLTLLRDCTHRGLIDEGRWKDLEEERVSMKESRWKERRLGCSWIEIDGKVHTFTAGKVSGKEVAGKVSGGEEEAGKLSGGEEVAGKVYGGEEVAGKVSGGEEVSHPEINAIQEKLHEISSYLRSE